MAVAIPIRATGGDATAAEFRRVGDAGERALQRIRNAAQPASASLRAIDVASREAQAGLEGFAGRLGPAGAVLGALGPAGVAAAAAVAGVGLALRAGIQDAAEAERSYNRLQGVLRATGGASGLTAERIVAVSESIEGSTLATAEAVQDAASVLATFRSVSGETFERTLKLAQDLSAVFGQGLSSSATQLGKALEDPIQGVTALRRVGVTFSDSQREVIASLVETGRVAEAQKLILDELQQQVGGAGAAEAQGLTGAFFRLTTNVGNFLEAVATRTGALERFTGLIDGLAAGAGRLAAAVNPTLAQQLAAVNRQIAELSRLEGEHVTSASRDEIFRAADPVVQARRRRDGLPPLAPEPQAPSRSEALKALEAEREQLLERLKLDRELEVQARRRAEAAAQQRTEEARRAKAQEEADERAKQAAKERAQLAEDVEKAVQRAREAQVKATEAIAEQVQGLKEEQAQIGLTERERAIRVELLKAEETARRAALQLTDAQAEAVRREAGALFDARQAAEERRKAEEEAKREAERAAAERKRLAEREAEEIARTVQRTADRIVDFGADAFDRILQGGRSSWRELADDLLGVMRRTFAQIAAEAIIRPILQPIVGNILGGALSGGGASGAASAGLGAGDLLSLGSLLSGGSILAAEGQAIVGNLALSLGLGRGGANALINGVGAAPWGALGSIAASLLFKDLNPVGSTLGGIVGSVGGGALGAAGLGTILGSAGGPVGAVVGAFLGSALGGKLGGGQSKRGATIGAGFNIGPDGRFFYQLAGDNGGDASALKPEAERALAMLNQLAELTGRMPSQAELAKVSKLIRVGTGDAFTNNIVQFARGGSRGADEMVRDLVYAGLFGDPNDPKLRTALTQGVEAAAQATQVSAAIQDMILAIADPVGAALKQLEAEHAARLEAVKAVGGDIVEAEKLYGLQRAQILKQRNDRELAELQRAEAQLEGGKSQLRQFFIGLTEQLGRGLSELSLGDLSALSPGEQLGVARTEFETLARAAQGGDVAAIQGLTAAGQALLRSQRAISAGGPEFAAAFREVNRVIGDVLGSVQREQASVFAEFGIRQIDTIRDGTRQQVEALRELQAEVRRLRQLMEGRAA